MVIEFDESHHLSKTNIKKDLKRETAIKAHVKEATDDDQVIIRVEAGKEITGLSKIAGYIALTSHSAIGITNLYE